MISSCVKTPETDRYTTIFVYYAYSYYNIIKVKITITLTRLKKVLNCDCIN